MFPFSRFPYTNFNELNLDWIMKKIKEFAAKIPGLEEKVDETYNYINENIGDIVIEQVTEQLPQILDDITLVWHDVTAFGATGDGVTDDTAAIMAAIDAGNAIFFPAGNYRFKQITVNKPLHILGTGKESVFIPIPKTPLTNQFYTMFTFNDSVFMRDIKLWADNSVVTQSGTLEYNQAAFVAMGSPMVYLEGVYFDHIYETYHKSVADQDFPNRHGMATYFYNCDAVVFNNCDFADFGGEELCNVAHDRTQPAKGLTIVNGCRFHDRTSGDTGSCINVLGGTLFFVNNLAIDFNNLYSDGTTGGSLFNFTSLYTVVANNIWKNCVCGNYFDISEGYWTKAENVIIANNIMNGSQKNPIHIGARNAYVFNNTIRGACIIRTFVMTATPNPLPVYCYNETQLASYEDLVIECNNFVTINTPFGDPQTASYDTCLGLGQHPAGQDPTQSRITVKGNTFSRASDAVQTNTIYLASTIGRCYITDNIFANTGEAYPGTGRAFISSGFKVAYLNVLNNVFDCSYTADDYMMVTGASVFRDESYIMLANNTAIETHSSTPGSITAFYGSPAHTTVNNNLNIT